MKTIAEYIWIDGQTPTGKLRSKTRLLEVGERLSVKDIPVWGFDGSSTEQASADQSDCILKPVKVCKNPLRLSGDSTGNSTIEYNSVLVLCEVLNADGSAGVNNYRDQATKVYAECKDKQPMFGIEQEYTLFSGHNPLGWQNGGYAPTQGPFYCGVGFDEEFGTEIVNEHMMACLDAGLLWCGKNGEVMPGQWEFQVGAGDPLTVSDDLWLARFLLFKVAAKYQVNAKLNPKPHPDLNGAGAHTNFSTAEMRADGGFEACCEAATRLGSSVAWKSPISDEPKNPEKDESVHTSTFPEEYGTSYKQRLTGEHETCSWEEFKWGVADRTASIRVPLHVAKEGKGYIEDRRPCADIDPYRVVSYIMTATCLEDSRVRVGATGEYSKTGQN